MYVYAYVCVRIPTIRETASLRRREGSDETERIKKGRGGNTKGLRMEQVEEIPEGAKRERERERRALDLSRQLNEFPLGWNGKRLEKRLPLRKIFRRALLDIREVISGRRRGAVCGLEVIHENTLDVRLSLSLSSPVQKVAVRPSIRLRSSVADSLSLSLLRIDFPKLQCTSYKRTNARTHAHTGIR